MPRNTPVKCPLCLLFRSSRPEVFFRMAVPKVSKNFHGTHTPAVEFTFSEVENLQLTERKHCYGFFTGSFPKSSEHLFCRKPMNGYC